MMQFRYQLLLFLMFYTFKYFVRSQEAKSLPYSNKIGYYFFRVFIKSCLTRDFQKSCLLLVLRVVLITIASTKQTTIYSQIIPCDRVAIIAYKTSINTSALHYRHASHKHCQYILISSHLNCCSSYNPLVKLIMSTPDAYIKEADTTILYKKTLNTLAPVSLLDVANIAKTRYHRSSYMTVSGYFPHIFTVFIIILGLGQVAFWHFFAIVPTN